MGDQENHKFVKKNQDRLEGVDINGDGVTNTNELRAAHAVAAAGKEIFGGAPLPEEAKSTIDDRVSKLVKNSQKRLIEAGMDLDGNGKVAMNEFRAALQVHGKSDLDAVLADANHSGGLNRKEIRGLVQESPSQNAR